ncbi:hypothetical protein GTH52_06980 [Clostridium tyrobutyricum]|uniref:Sequestrin n=1 Tax=Clostridium tyrobutyricum DIVETGP TaxID=1408889 RepID=W6N5A8_CLOTY|nr:hypothetical protein [Clostridium tyrobutyricum]AND84289.1 hypothetical protein CTK_C10280 [Clostridium tyrobutyricum]AND84373.1 hypothetical protein CTK_C11120 [Clostridium tyrobutyricum]ANP69000.1 hypothetical protein BA182_04725 [Clostridium tyrobutyricum]MBV4432431.1 hypothetical protein [Clostridium tyrobutyricum]MBV4435394.1 hypothetical protein [Clostridium tyrobutyricum]
MSLHTIPLCNFKYAGDNICSGATFKYDTRAEIINYTPKLLSLNNQNNVNKVESQLFSGSSMGNMFKSNISILNKNSVDIIDKSELKSLYVPKKAIIKDNRKQLKKHKSEIFKHSSKMFKFGKKDIFIGDSIILQNLKAVNLIKYSNLQLKNSENISISIENVNVLQDIKDFIINIPLGKNLCDKKVNDLLKSTYESLNAKNGLELNRYTKKYLSDLINKEILKNNYCIFNTLNRYRDINKLVGELLRRNVFKEIILDKDRNFYERDTVVTINKIKNMFLRRFIRIDTSKVVLNFMLSKSILRKITQIDSITSLDRSFYKHIYKALANKTLKKNIKKDMFKIMESTYFDRGSIKNIVKISGKSFRRFSQKSMYENTCRYLGREKLIEIFTQNEKQLSEFPIIDILKLNELYIKNYTEKEVFKPGKNKFIDIIKRLWWLNPTDPGDTLIIPNKDFCYNQEFLNNEGYEYLRFKNHPIDWGNTWGIDCNIPTYSVSIEIMLDLVNILIMIWHDNVQGWLCCSGKESMQFIMELLYDWYTLETSKPNSDYYRAYRWIRWEAEKVYFLNYYTGLQAIGVLIANLIAYLKNHHFNTVPLWRNSKAMDIERNFNRIAQNGDIIKSLNKTKGRRYYYIDTQNIEKKNILGDDTNGQFNRF